MTTDWTMDACNPPPGIDCIDVVEDGHPLLADPFAGKTDLELLTEMRDLLRRANDISAEVNGRAARFLATVSRR